MCDSVIKFDVEYCGDRFGVIDIYHIKDTSRFLCVRYSDKLIMNLCANLCNYVGNICNCKTKIVD